MRKPAGQSTWNGAGSAAEAETRGTPPPLAQSRWVRRRRAAQVFFTAVVADEGVCSLAVGQGGRRHYKTGKTGWNRRVTIQSF